MKKHWQYLKYVLRHKWFVMLYCFGYGLIWRGLVHDLSKFRPREWFPYANYFYGKRITLRSEQGDFLIAIIGVSIEGFDRAWNHHQKRNDHHWQYWLLTLDTGETKALEMPISCAREMLADWRGAGRALDKPNTWEWYAANKDNIVLHSDTRAWVEKELARLEENYHSDNRMRTLGII